MRFLIVIVGVLCLWLPHAALAGPEDELLAMRADAMAIPGATVTEFPDFTMVQDPGGLTIFYFTKPGHYAHPAAVQRVLAQSPDGAWRMHYLTWPYDQPQTAPAPFRQWMDEFFELDRAMAEDIARNRGR